MRRRAARAIIARMNHPVSDAVLGGAVLVVLSYLAAAVTAPEQAAMHPDRSAPVLAITPDAQGAAGD